MLARADRFNRRVSERMSDARKSAKDATKGGVRGMLGRTSARVKTFMYEVVQTSRSEHTIMNAIAPPEEDILGDSLQDEQVIHIFWSTVLGELATLFMLSDASNDSEYPLVQILYLGIITSIIVSVLAKIMKDIFKFCNKKRRRQSMYDRFKRRWAQPKKKKIRDLRKPPRTLKSTLRALPSTLLWAANPYNWAREWKASKARARFAERQRWLSEPLERTFMPKKVRRMQKEALRRERAAVKLQSVSRRRDARRRMLTQRKLQGYDDAATRLQAASRRRASQKEVYAKRQEAADERASLAIQAAQRRRQATAEVKARRQQQQRNHCAATTMQAAQRRRAAKAEARALAEARNEVQPLMQSEAQPSPPPSPPLEAPPQSTVPSITGASGLAGGGCRVRKTNAFLARLAAAAEAEAPPTADEGTRGNAPDTRDQPAEPNGSSPDPATTASVGDSPDTPPLDSGAGALLTLSSQPPAPAEQRAHAPADAPTNAPTNAPANAPTAAAPVGLAARPAAASKGPKLLLALSVGAGAGATDAEAASGASANQAGEVTAAVSDAQGAKPACQSKLLLKALGGSGAAAATPTKGGAAGNGNAQTPDVFKTNRFLARFAESAKSDGESGEKGTPISSSTKGQLKVELKRAHKLKAADINLFSANSSDPYVILHVGGKEKKSKVVPKNLNPVWNETFVFDGHLHDFIDTGLTLSVFDEDRYSSDDPLGEVQIDLAEFETKTYNEYHEALSTKGTLDFSISWLAEKRGGLALWKKARGIAMMTQRVKLSAEEAERIRRSTLVPFSRKYILFRWTLGWIINMTIFIFLWLANWTYGVTFGPVAFESILLAWGLALFQTWIIVEPSEVVGIVLLPSLANHPYIAKCRANLKEYGFI